MSLGLSAWTVVVLPFRDIFVAFLLPTLALGAGDLAFLGQPNAGLSLPRG